MMTRLLVLSDVHGCVPAVEAVVAIERGGGFDAAVVAGDIGPNPDDFFRALAPLGCPVLYVYGNWDHELAYDRQFGAHAVHLQGAAVPIGDLHFLGFSGCEVHWGRNPHLLRRIAELKRPHQAVLKRLADALRNDERRLAPRRDELLRELDALRPADGARESKRAAERIKAVEHELFKLSLTGGERERVKESAAYRRYCAAVARAVTEVAEANREDVFKRIRRTKLPHERTVLVTHERQFRLQDRLKGLGAHFFGHRHGFKVTYHVGTVFVNVSCIDPVHTTSPQYGIIDWTPAKGFHVEEKALAVDKSLFLKCHQYYSDGLRQESLDPRPRLDWMERLSIPPRIVNALATRR